MRKLLPMSILAGIIFMIACNKNPEPTSSNIDTTVAPASETEVSAELDSTANGTIGSVSVEASDSTK